MNEAWRRILTIVIGSVGLASTLGIAVDLVTANLAVEYFTVHHPRIVATENPWLLALAWGIAASWWFGLIAGCIVAVVNHLRARPLAPIRILKWNLVACCVIWVCMMSILVVVMLVSSRIPLEQRRETFESDRRLIAVALAHQYEYAFGTVAILAISIMTWRSKDTKQPVTDLTPKPDTPSISG